MCKPTMTLTHTLMKVASQAVVKITTEGLLREKRENTPLRTYPIKYIQTQTLSVWSETNFLTAGLVYNILF